ncbi:cobalt-precorrin-5B (C(1))-methyltransferase CbiD [Vulcanisaeta sp. JCM 14467]
MAAVMNTLRRFGITTGAAAAAAAKAAVVFLLTNERPGAVVVPTPIGLRIEVPVEGVWRDGEYSCAEVRKFSGDNPDVLDGAVIRACVRVVEGTEVRVFGGRGVGVVTRSGLRVGVGEWAISPAARGMVVSAVREVTGVGLEVVIEVPNGEALAEKTMNRLVGVVGGISILGTTGIETPVSSEDYIEHIKCELNAVRQAFDYVVIAPGNSAARYASSLFDGGAVVKVGDRVGDAVRLASTLFSRVVLAGLPAKLLKVYAGILNTHYTQGDARIESLTHAAVIAGLPYDVVARVANSLSVEEAFSYMTKDERRRVMGVVAERVLTRLAGLSPRTAFCVVIFDYDGEVLARVGCP